MQKTLKQKLKILLKSSFVVALLLIIVGCATPFEKTLKQVDRIDQKYGTSVEDYSKGMSYFANHAREIPLNLEEIDEILTQLEKLKQGKEDEDSIAYLNFRIKLLESEKLYKSASRRPFSGINDAIRCNRKEALLLSIDEVKQSINASTEAVEAYLRKEVKIELSEEWINGLLNDNGKIYQNADTKSYTIINYCNSSQTE